MDPTAANEISIKEIEDFLNDDGTGTAPVEEPETQPETNETQAFAHRLKKSTEKARQEERENIAKALGFENYEVMLKDKENKLFEAKGLDPTEVAPVVEEIIKKRLAEDPRLKELEEFQQKKMEEWAKKELATITELTGGKVSDMKQLPKEVIELWKQKGSLKAAYLELEGEKLIREMQNGITSGQSKGNTNHLSNPQGTPPPKANLRPMTNKEKEVYKLFNPNVTEEQLNKMYKEI